MLTIHPFYILVVSNYLKIVEVYIMQVTVLVDYTASFFILVLPPRPAYQISAVVILGDSCCDTNSYAAICPRGLLPLAIIGSGINMCKMYSTRI